MFVAGETSVQNAPSPASILGNDSRVPFRTELFIDNHMLEATPGVSRRLHPAKKHLLKPVIRSPSLVANNSTFAGLQSKAAAAYRKRVCDVVGCERLTVFIVEVLTRSGRICENHATYEDARRRIEQLPAEYVLSCPLIFQDLVDGSQRLVCEDGKPLQFHRLPWDEPPAKEQAPLPLADIEQG